MKCAIITITEGENFGNRLQNYATQQIFERNSYTVETLNNYKDKIILIEEVKKRIKRIIKRESQHNRERKMNFKQFNENYIQYSKYKVSNRSNNKKLNKKYDLFICGSDQIWNPNYQENAEVNFLDFSNKKNDIAFAPSFGSSTVPEKRKYQITEWLNNIKYISVREDAGKRIIEELTGRTDVEVLVDPTMLLTAEEWDKVSKKPKHLKSNQRYILNYFLGELSEKRRNEIRRVAEKNDCEIINILDEKDPFYTSGPSEFLYLEKHAFLICTDSFHSSVFAIIYDKPFIVFEREDDTVSMNSRLETLLNKFKLNTRYCKDDKINEMLLNHDYTEAYKILEKEKQKSYNFIRKALENN